MKIKEYFPKITNTQESQLESLATLYKNWNDKINVISRKDMDNFEVRHVLHSLSIARCFSFASGTTIMDAGTGGGFPGIPLAIMFPEVSFTLVDSIGKKIRVVDMVANELNLKNVTAVKGRFEEIRGTFDFITGRAVTALPGMFAMLKNKVSAENKNTFPNGIIYLKGGDFEEELQKVPSTHKIWHLSSMFDEPFFDTKKLVYLYDFR